MFGNQFLQISTIFVQEPKYIVTFEKQRRFEALKWLRS